MRSELCIYDIATEAVSVLLDYDGHIEAPNWHPEGYLIVNSEGALYRVAMDAPDLRKIDTGFADACNNDHGISPDGQTLVISDQSRTAGSCIYTLPIDGGMPSRITAHVPCYWHGWSPDGARLTYVSKRDGGPFALYTCAARGGDERLLSDAFDHIDGPDYTPDGHWIWFNGERQGAVDLWRIRPDGTGLGQMTHDNDVNWFPHPSPDGRYVLYLAYPPGTKGHPSGTDVGLRLMAPGVSQAHEVVRLHGGQGSINVPSWAPDGTAFAFVRYTD